MNKLKDLNEKIREGNRRMVRVKSRWSFFLGGGFYIPNWMATVIQPISIGLTELIRMCLSSDRNRESEAEQDG